MQIKVFENKNDLYRAFTDWVKTILSEHDKITIALSGGSTPRSLYDYWANLPKGEIDWQHVLFFWGDERCVPPSHDDSNYRMTQEHFFDKVSIPKKNIFRIRGENDPESESRRYSQLLKEEIYCENGFPVFDIVMLGLGDDGHTVSIFPHKIDLWNSPEVCVQNAHPQSGQKRVSLSGNTINAARNVAFLVTGKAKAEKVKDIIESPETSMKKYPAALARPTFGNLYWFLDDAAAYLLS